LFFYVEPIEIHFFFLAGYKKIKLWIF